MSPVEPVAAPPPASSLSVFKEDIFAGKVLFATGGGTGIGRAMTEAVLRHGANATIVGRNIQRNERSAEELAAATGRTVLAAQADVREPKQLADAVAKTIAKFGRIDFVICGAAGNFIVPVGQLSENGFKTVISIDVVRAVIGLLLGADKSVVKFGTYNTVKATLPHIRASKGSYLHISATLHYRGFQLQSHVSAAKAAVDAFSAVLAVEEGPRGVRSNVIAPGPIAETEGVNRLVNPKFSPNGNWIPLQRMGHVDDIANATVFLFSDAAPWVTGQVLVVDGGDRHTMSSSFEYPQSVLNPMPRL